MDQLFQKALQDAAALKKQPDSVPWTPDTPWPQPYYAWDKTNKQWQPSSPFGSNTSPQAPTSNISTLSLYSWNIDFMLPLAELRMSTALGHLRELLQELDPDSGIVIHLQECTASDLTTIARTPWIRDAFYLTDIDPSAWGSGLYGTVSLIDRRLAITACYRVHFAQTRMERDGLFVDVLVNPASGSSTRTGTGNGKKIRLCTTHLESMALDPPLRPAQMRISASQMRAPGIAGAIVMGDFNAIQPADVSLHAENGLKDAYLELGGREGAEEGYTWGQQALPAQRRQFGCSRMDKAFYCGEGVKVRGFERFGAGVVVPQIGDAQDRLLGLGFERAWVTDHLGVKVVFDLDDGVRCR